MPSRQKPESQIAPAPQSTDDPDDDPEASPESEAELAHSPEAEAISGFARLGLIEPLLQSIRELGFEEPTPIQRQAIPLLLEGRDVIAQAQTGTGKTAAFALPLLQRLAVGDRSVQALILSPTRELAVQVAGQVHALGRHLEVSVLPIYGGQPIERQLRALRFGVQVVIGTPGRILDHLRRGSLNLEYVTTLVLDEADEMLDMGFEEEIEEIVGKLSDDRQTSLFSATIPPRIAALGRRYLQTPTRVSIGAEKLTVPQIKQTYYEVAPRAKLDALSRILDMEAPGAAIIFCRTKRDVDEIGEALMARGYPAETLHGDLSQPMRDRVMRRFREGQAELLVATDVAARGLDIEHVSHVINFNIPEDPEQYVHRIGRTARAGRTGDAITLVTPREMRWLREIERLIRKKIRPARVPTAGDIAAKRLEVTKAAIARAIREGGLDPYLMAVEDLASDGDLTQVAAATLKLVMERDGAGARPVVTAMDGDAAQGVEAGMQRLFIDVGRKQGIRPSDIVGVIANEAGIPGSDIGAIDIYDNFTFVEVAGAVVANVIEALQDTTLRGKEFRVDIARPRDEPPASSPAAPQVRLQRRVVPAAQPAVAEPQESEDGDFEPDEDEDEPPQRPADWREGALPRSMQRYPRQGAPRQGAPRRGPAPATREGFGPFRGPEPREAPPWQRRRQQSDRPGPPARRNDFEGSNDPNRPRRTEGASGFPARRDEGGFRARRGPEQGGFQGPRPDDWTGPRRTGPPYGGSGPGRRRPSGPPSQRPPRRRPDE